VERGLFITPRRDPKGRVIGDDELGHVGRSRATLSPAFTPIAVSARLKRFTSASSSRYEIFFPMKMSAVRSGNRPAVRSAPQAA